MYEKNIYAKQKQRSTQYIQKKWKIKYTFLMYFVKEILRNIHFACKLTHYE